MDNDEEEIDLSLTADNRNSSNIPLAVATPIYDSVAAAAAAATTTTTATAVVESTGGRPSLKAKDHNSNHPTNNAAVLSAVFHTSVDLAQHQIVKLQQQFSFPYGLAHALGNTRITYPLRFWIVDNSGSMQTNDGQQIRGGGENHRNHNHNNMVALRVVNCTRWTELVGTVEFHAVMAGLLEATTVFRFLNDPGPNIGPQEFSVAETTSPSIESDVSNALSILQRVTPRGATPLTQHILTIRARIQESEAHLRAHGQHAVLVLATDGLPSNPNGESNDAVHAEFIAALKSLQTLPVWIVVRLCTDDASVVDFFNNLDAVLELPLEVIDDFFGEAREIYQCNKWLNYGLPLHRCREMGYHHRIFDLLDERSLNKDELKQFLVLLLGSNGLEKAPDPNVDWSGFLRDVTQLVKAESKQWNPITRKLEYWIDLKQLDKTYGKRGFFRRK